MEWPPFLPAQTNIDLQRLRRPGLRERWRDFDGALSLRVEGEMEKAPSDR